MPVLTVERRPPRIFVRTQLPFLIGLVLVVVPSGLAVDLTRDEAWRLAIGCAIGVCASVLLLRRPDEWSVYRVSLGISVADLVAVTLVNSALVAHTARAGDTAVVGMLAIFPVVWLSYGFGDRVGPFLLGQLGALVATAPGVAPGGRLPDSAQDWAAAMITPCLVCLVGVAVREVVHQQRTYQEQLTDALGEATLAASTIRAVADASGTAIALFGTTGGLELLTEPAARLARLAGMDPATYMSTRLYDVRGQDLVPDELQPVPRVRRGEVLRKGLYWVGPPGDQRAVSIESRRIAVDGTVLGNVVVGQDVTELVNAIRVREEFLVTISHELRTPLTSIVGYLDLIEDDPRLRAAPDLARAIDTVQRNTEQLEAIIAQLLDAVPGTMSLHRRTVALDPIVRQSIESLAPRAAAGEVRLVVSDAEGVSAWIDPEKIRQVLDNLLLNAVKYSPAGSQVSVAVRAEGADCVIAVSDDGIGISEEDQRQLFDRFFRASSSRERAVQGLGLGLPISRAIVEAHGGTLTVESVLGEGSTFTVRVPSAPLAR